MHLIAGGFPLVAAPDDVIAKAVSSLKERFKLDHIAPGHRTGEPTFAALKQAFGDRYIYAGVGTLLAIGSEHRPAVSDVASDPHSMKVR